MPSIASGISYNYATTPFTMINAGPQAGPPAIAVVGRDRTRSPVAAAPPASDMEISPSPTGATAAPLPSTPILAAGSFNPNTGLAISSSPALPPPDFPSDHQDLEAAVSAAFHKNTPSFLQSLQAPITNLCQKATSDVVAVVGKRLDKLESGQSDLRKGQQDLQEGQAKLLASLKSLEEKFILHHSKSTPDLQQAPFSQALPSPSNPAHTSGVTGFFRAPNPCLVFANSHGQAKINRTTFLHLLHTQLTEVNMAPTDVEVTGDELDNRFDILFLGPSAPAKAVQYLQSHLTTRGRHKKYDVLTPDGTSVQVYFNPDKNPATVRKEVVAKQLRDFLQSQLPSGKLAFCRRSTGSIFVDRRVVCNVYITEDGGYKLTWEPVLLLPLKLSEEDLTEGFKATTGGVPSP